MRRAIIGKGKSNNNDATRIIIAGKNLTSNTSTVNVRGYDLSNWSNFRSITAGGTASGYYTLVRGIDTDGTNILIGNSVAGNSLRYLSRTNLDLTGLSTFNYYDSLTDAAAIVDDETYWYISNTNYIDKRPISSIGISSGQYNVMLQQNIFVDDNYLYVYNGLDFLQLNKGDFTVNQSLTLNGIVRDIFVDDNYIFIGGSFTGTNQNRFAILNKSDFSLVAYSGFDESVYAISNDDNYLYVGGSFSERLAIINRTNFTTVGYTGISAGTVYDIANTSNHIYLCGTFTNKFRGLTKSDLTTLTGTPTFVNTSSIAYRLLLV